MYKVVNETSQSDFVCEGGETILEAALRQGHILPYSCRNGTCSSCKAVLVKGTVEHDDYDKRALSEADLAANKALLCRARPTSDVTIRAREAKAASGLAIKILPCRVSALTHVAHDVMQVHLALPKVQTLEYLAGQYIDILLRDGRRRSFSIANRPEQGQDLELHIRKVDGGRFSTQVFESMKARDLLRFEGPLGTFFLRDATTAPVILVAGGTGFAPVKGIIEHALHNSSTRPMHLFWGVRALKDLYMGDLCQRWAETHDTFEFTPVLSDPADGDNWSGLTGFVHDAVVGAYPSLTAHEVYASGPPVMIDAGRKAFAHAALSDESLYYDSFEYALT